MSAYVTFKPGHLATGGLQFNFQRKKQCLGCGVDLPTENPMQLRCKPCGEIHKKAYRKKLVKRLAMERRQKNAKSASGLYPTANKDSSKIA